MRLIFRRFIFFSYIIASSFSTILCINSKADRPALAMLVPLKCDLLDLCSTKDTRFGMIGDSWSDILEGTPLVRDLHDQLVYKWGYRIDADVESGRKLSDVTNSKNHLKLIRENPRLEYILVSLGGNDLFDETGKYSLGELQGKDDLGDRLDGLQKQILLIIEEGNSLKKILYGGENLRWIFHSYDYPNPSIDGKCIRGIMQSGTGEFLPDAYRWLDKITKGWGDVLSGIQKQRADFQYIDLRGTLGGPPTSNSKLMLDCIHPNSDGFNLIGDKYVLELQKITPNKF